MSTILRTETLDPHALSAAEREDWIRRLYAVHCEIFDGVSRESFAAYVVNSPADKTTIHVSFGEDDEIAGYLALHNFYRELQGERCLVMRAEAGLRRAWRGDGSPGANFASQVLRNRVEFQGPQFYLGCLVHPSSYVGLARAAARIWPSPGEPTPEPVQEFMGALGDEFHLERVDPARPLVREVGWITRDTPSERRYWLENTAPLPSFYIAQNPGFVDGHGLLTLIPLDLGNASRSLVNWGSARIKKSIRRSMDAIERTVTRPTLADREADALLEMLSQSTGLDLSGLRGHAALGRRYPVAARSRLFSAGDKGDAIYFVVSGALQVIDEDETVLDQLGPGTVVGEMATLLDQPRSATVRAATDSVLLRISAAELAQALAWLPEAEAQVWRVVSTRLLNDAERELGLATALDAPRRPMDPAAEILVMNAEDSHTVSGERVLVLAKGELHLQTPDGWAALRAPAVLTAAEGTRLRAPRAARVLLARPRG